MQHYKRKISISDSEINTFSQLVPDRGAVTAELAVALPGVVLLLLTILGLGAAFGTQMRVSDAARTAARLYSVSAGLADITAVAQQVAGQSAVVELLPEHPLPGEWATITVRRSASFGPANLGPLLLSGSATVWLEP
ncbi:MAG: pilus assembly protein [Cellulomonadaceae bacterium]|jgi:hypothetical protein|nr:pilus assembly protein [Cellulomonadaceae bacterium]